MSKLLIPNTCQVPNVLLDEVIPRLSAGAVRVLLAIVRFTYGFQKESDRISLSQLQKITGLSRQGVVQGIAALRPLLKITPGAKGKGANEYSLNLNVSTGKLVSEFDQSTKLTSQQKPRDVVNKVDSPKPSISKPNKTGAKAPEISPSRRERKPTRPRDPDPAQVEAFARFYSAYPRHVDRETAQRAWLRLSPSPELQMLIMAAVARYAAENEGTEQRFIKHPAAWLNGNRWEDEPAGGNGNGHAKPAQVKDLGNGIVEADGLKMTRRDYERKYGARAN